MAEIHVQEKRRPVWPWIVGVLAVIAVAILALAVFNGENGVTGVAATEERTIEEEDAALPASVLTYLQHVESIEQSDVIHTMEHDYVSGGLRLLAAALEDVARGPVVAPPAQPEATDAERQPAGAAAQQPAPAEQPAATEQPAAAAPLDASYNQRLTELRQRARSIPADPLTLDHTVHAYEAFVLATELLAEARAQRPDDRGRAAERHIDEARSALETMSSAHLLNTQRDHVLRWMRASADALRELAHH